MAFYLEDVVGELEAEGKEYSKEWYYAKVSQLYFSDVEIPDVAMTIGILLAQLWWRADLGDVAERGQANSEALHKANSVRKERSKFQSAERNRVSRPTGLKHWRNLELKRCGETAMLHKRFMLSRCASAPKNY